jgi:hypothetical protein
MFLNFVGATALSSNVTFSRGSNATLVDSTGKITYAPANLVLRSEELDNAAWAKSALAVTANAATAPDGTLTADKLIADATTAVHTVGQGFSVSSGVTVTGSVYAKAGEYNFISLLLLTTFAASQVIICDLRTGTITTTTGSPIATSVTNVGNGWYRISITQITNSTGTATLQVRPTDNGTTAFFTGNGTSGVFAWGAQFEQVTYQTAPSTYVATTSAAYYGPRFDYDPVTLAAKGLLIEEQRTNLLLQSQTLDNASWSKSNGTITANTIASPDGTTNADAFIENTAASAFHFTAQSIVKAASNIQYAVSFYVKDKGRQVAFSFNSGASGVAGRVNPATGTITAAIGTFGTGWTAGSLTMTDAGNGWYRVVVVATSDILLTATFQLSLTIGATNVYTGDGVSGAYIWGAQMEAAAFPTSYIPTVASTVTRSADVATMTGTNFSSWFNTTQGTFVSQFTTSTISGTRTVLDANDNTANESIRLRTMTADPFFTVTDGGVDQANIDVGTVAANITYTMAGAYSENDFAASIGGGTVGVDTSGTIPTVNQLQIGNSPAGNRLNGHVRTIAYYNTRLSDATLQALTA